MNNADLNNTLQTDFNVLAEQLDFLLGVPNEMFETIYPTLIEEMEKALKSGEFKASLPKTQDREVKRYIKNELDKVKTFIKEEGREQLSQKKIDYLNFILDSLYSTIENIPYRETVPVRLELCHPNAKIPTYAHSTDAGCDVYAVEDCTIAPGSTKILGTGLKVAVPDGWVLSVRPRSGMSAKTKIRIANAPGSIDAGYRDEIGIIVDNIGTEPYTISVGDRIAQFIIEPAPMIVFNIVNSVHSFGEDRGGGFGSSGI
jgi:dUTP pyrophosphatase